MHVVPATLLSAAVTILAVLFVFYTGINVAQMRGKHKISAPSVTGNPEFERAYRVQVNTLEQFVMFLPLLWLATTYFQSLGWLPAVFGLVWIVGRFMYLQGYMAAPEKRGTGFMITSLATAGLLVLSLIGIVQAWMAVTAV
jgi:glutathione S-transferase